MITFDRYVYNQPSELPVEYDIWFKLPDGCDDLGDVIAAAGLDPDDEEIGVGLLEEQWQGHVAGCIVVSGLTVEGHPFAVETTASFLGRHPLNSDTRTPPSEG